MPVHTRRIVISETGVYGIEHWNSFSKRWDSPSVSFKNKKEVERVMASLNAGEDDSNCCSKYKWTPVD
jgi:hypothetical protein